MQLLVEAYTPEKSPVNVRKMTCAYQAQKAGVYANLDFEVLGTPEEVGPKRGPLKKKTHDPGADDLEAIEFTFVLLDIFDNYLSTAQGIAGPGHYAVGSWKNNARWIFDLDGAFSQYHALCFPSQARFLNGRIWRCDRNECIDWLNFRLRDAGIVVTEENVFPESAAQEGISD